MPERNPNDLTMLLEQMGRGDRDAADRLFPLVYEELRALAGSLFRKQSPGHTLQPTALVHDAYVRLIDQTSPQWKDRGHFFAVAAKAMRQILTDHARRQQAVKRGGGDKQRIVLNDDVAFTAKPTVDLLALDEAMQALAALDERKARVVELKFFAGLGNDEIADVLHVSRATVADDWTVARAFLKSQLVDGGSA
jgi:RNA polymerase sigma factor (TIGR02999 family)